MIVATAASPLAFAGEGGNHALSLVMKPHRIVNGYILKPTGDSEIESTVDEFEYSYSLKPAAHTLVSEDSSYSQEYSELPQMIKEHEHFKETSGSRNGVFFAKDDIPLSQQLQQCSNENTPGYFRKTQVSQERELLNLNQQSISITECIKRFALQQETLAENQGDLLLHGNEHIVHFGSSSI